jgi:hypothetical protein
MLSGLNIDGRIGATAIATDDATAQQLMHDVRDVVSRVAATL